MTTRQRTVSSPASQPELACPPRFSTPRNYARETLGGKVADVAAKLGTPLMPWQRHVVDVAFEVDPATGDLAYSEVVLTVPRQSGKTTLILAVAVHRALAASATGKPWAAGAQNIVYTAQTRNDARKKWEDDQVDAVLRKSIFRNLFRVRLSNGAEAVKWRNGSRYGISAGTETSGHGSTLDLGFIDEAFSRVDSRGEQAMKPAMITRSGSQLWVVSTAGTPDSVYLRGKVDKGRVRVLSGQPSTVAYFEWSAPDEDGVVVDHTDPAVWWACMPALGHTVSEATIRGELEMDEDDFRRAYLNQWRDRKQASRVIPESDWVLCEDEDSSLANPDEDAITLAVATTPDRAWSAIGLAGVRADGLDHIEVINHKPGTDWLLDRVLGIRERRNVVAVVIDPASPAGSLIVDFEAAGVDVTKTTAQQMAQACGSLYDAVVPPLDAPAGYQRTVKHRGQVSLNAALAGAKKRPLADSWALDRKGSADICPLEVVILARWARAQHVEAEAYDVLDSFY